MKPLPREILEAWKNREGAAVFTTVARDGVPNSIYVTCVDIYEDSLFVVADNFFCKTKANIQDGSAASVLFITKDEKSYQVKGSIEYHSDGRFFDFMKSWNPKRLPGHAAAVVVPDKAYSGANELK